MCSAKTSLQEEPKFANPMRLGKNKSLKHQIQYLPSFKAKVSKKIPKTFPK